MKPTFRLVRGEWIPVPTLALYKYVVTCLHAQGSSIAAWCRVLVVTPEYAKSALICGSKTDKGRYVRKYLLRAVGMEAAA